jgi:ABC-type polysaccharide/polyol phosphate export permease
VLNNSLFPLAVVVALMPMLQLQSATTSHFHTICKTSGYVAQPPFVNSDVIVIKH